MKNKVLKTLLKVGMVSSSVIMGIALVAGEITSANRIAISNQLKQPTFEIIQKENEDGQVVDTQYFKSEFKNLRELIDAGIDLTAEIMSEGAVLLENENNALPLAAKEKVTLLGTASQAVSYGGRGSSQTDKPQDPTDIVEGFTAAGIEVNPVMASYYENACKPMEGGRKYFYNARKVYELGFQGIAANAGALKSLEEYNTAVVVLSRNGSEGGDLTVDPVIYPSDDEDPTVTREKAERRTLNLSTNEKELLSNVGRLKKEGKIKKVIVVFSSTNQIEQADFLPEYGIDAALWTGHYGMNGTLGLGKLLTGEVAPSGHLPDTFYYDHADNPVLMNYPYHTLSNKADFPEFSNELSASARGDHFSRYYAYQEGVYVGYRYAETRYTDVVEGKASKAKFDYDNVIYKAFGSGKSYTTFEYSDFEVKRGKEENTFDISVTVKNTGDVAAKDAVQFYLSKPYTEFDIERKIEKPAVELVGFEKTDVIKPGETQRVTTTIDKEVLKTYDREVDKTYIVTPGTYGLTAAQDAHDAANNFLAQKGYGVKDGMTAEGNDKLVTTFPMEYDKNTYSVSQATGNRVTNLFDEADINKYHGKDDASKKVENSLEFLSRNNWDKELTVDIKATQALVDDMKRQLNSDFIADLQNKEDKYPNYGTAEETHALQLVSLLKDEQGNEISYDDPAWNAFLDQLTWDETVELLRIGGRCTNGLPSINKPKTVDHNGPTGITMSYGAGKGLANPDPKDPSKKDPLADLAPVYYPSIPVVAASFNKDLATRFGNLLGEDALWAGYAGFYGVGLNTHRSPYAGRQFEYWSEDPMLAGTLAAHQVKALQSHGCNAYIKHFALNDQEAQRNNVQIWSNEQALREISLRPFEIAVREGGAMNAMASFTRIGATMVPGSKALLTDWLRGEVGMRGLVVTDMWIIGYKADMLPSLIMAGCDIPDGEIDATVFDKYKEGYPTLAQAMRESVKRVCYSTLKSNAMNGFDTNTIVKSITPPWEKAMSALKITSIVYFSGMSVCGLIALSMALVPLFKKKETR